MVMYTVPALYGADEYLQPVEADEIDVCQEECTFVDGLPCDRDMFELFILYMEENGLDEPSDAFEAVDLYMDLRERLLIDLYH